MPHFISPTVKKETTASALKPLSVTKVTVYSIRSNISPSHELGEVGFDLFQDLIVEFGKIKGFCRGKLVYAKALGSPQVCFVQTGILEIGTHQVGVSQVSLHKERVPEIGFDQEGIIETSLDEKRVLEVRAAGVSALQVRLVEI